MSNAGLSSAIATMFVVMLIARIAQAIFWGAISLFTVNTIWYFFG